MTITKLLSDRTELARLEQEASALEREPDVAEIQKFRPGAMYRLGEAIKLGDLQAVRGALSEAKHGLAESRRPKPVISIEPVVAYFASQLACSASDVQARITDLVSLHRASEGDLKRLAMYGPPSLSDRLVIAAELGRAPDDLAAAVKSSLRKPAMWNGFGTWPRRWAERVETLVGTPPQLTGEPRRQATAERFGAAIGALADAGEWRAVRWLVKLYAQLAAACVPQDGEPDPEFIAAVATEQLERHMRA